METQVYTTEESPLDKKPLWPLIVSMFIQGAVTCVSAGIAGFFGLFSGMLCDNGCDNEMALVGSFFIGVPAIILVVGFSFFMATFFMWRESSGGKLLVGVGALTLVGVAATLGTWWLSATLFIDLFVGSP